MHSLSNMENSLKYYLGKLFDCAVLSLCWVVASLPMPGKKAIDTITFMETELDENDIISIEDIELSFHIFDAETWDTIVDTDVVSIVF